VIFVEEVNTEEDYLLTKIEMEDVNLAVRKIIKIDEEKCDGCGICIPQCAEGALQIINGKGKHISEHFREGFETPSNLGHWPIQLKLVPTNAPYFQEADLLIVADCIPFAYADFHRDLLKAKPLLWDVQNWKIPIFARRNLPVS
jgi:ferredoxin